MRSYTAPALSRGLQILEFLSTQKTPLTLHSIASQLNMSVSHIYRIVQVLHTHGYIKKDKNTESFALTPKLFLLSMNFRDNSTLFDAVSPILEEISSYTKQSVHFAIQTDKNISVIARSHLHNEASFVVRIGYTKPMQNTNSGLLLLAFASKEEREAVLKVDKALEKTFDKICKDGYYMNYSYYAKGIIDISIPLFSKFSKHVIGALTIPYVYIEGRSLSLKETAKYIRSFSPCVIPF